MAIVENKAEPGVADKSFSTAKNDGVYTDAEAITPSNTEELSDFCAGIYVGGAGNVNVVMRTGVEVLFTAVPVGTILPIVAKQVKATSTTATGLVALR